MTQDTLTALLLNPFLTFDEAEREHGALTQTRRVGERDSIDFTNRANLSRQKSINH